MKYYCITIVLSIITTLLILSITFNYNPIVECFDTGNQTSLMVNEGVFPSVMIYTTQPPEIDPEKGYAVIEIANISSGSLLVIMKQCFSLLEKE